MRLALLALTIGGACTQSPAQTPSTLDYEFFKTKVQPIFLAKRPGHARCIECHDSGTPRLQELPEGAATWNEEQSRKNFEAWQRVVVPGEPMSSRLLMHPLAPEAGGDPFHAGGKHWKSQNDPEFQTLVAWVKTGTPQTSSAASALDFEYYRTHVEPIFLKPREANEGTGNACASCHTKIASRMRLQPLSSGAKRWTEEQSRSNFAVVAKLIVPGNPAASPLLKHPLAADAGGDPTHTGGKFWKSKENPEWQMLSAWVSGSK